MDVKIPETWSEDKLQDYMQREKKVSQEWQKTGKWKYLWRVTGRYSNISVIEVESPDELHEIVSSLPLFPYMKLKVTSICKHPNAIKKTIL
jgi:muconolactone D-isomerase